ncbi:hypothetical protein GGP85_003095 [Salinibacter ruber]|uniref:hypothetical protein n=1 Tax=Salinibacter ruber TaxID=146919 RepID=UPI002169E08D|nr:hypothetical protein [Salinibacter ruber]MCS3827625.1 hypothetical protein [Salinibacter ruber]
MIAGGLILPFEGQAQELRPEIERQAQEAFHGPDLEGKDGPMAKVGLDLARLYYRREYALQEGKIEEGKPEEEKPGKETPFKAPASMQVDSGGVVVDAIAVSDSAEALRQSLAGLGAESLALSGRIVSGRLPIGMLLQAADLSALRSMQPARARTHGQPTPSQRYEMGGSIRGSKEKGSKEKGSEKKESEEKGSEKKSGGDSKEKAPGPTLGIFLLIGTLLLIERT